MRTAKLKAALWVIVPLLIMATIVLAIACVIIGSAALVSAATGPDRARLIFLVIGAMIPLVFFLIRVFRPEFYERLKRM
jgi:hypothetical protein